MFPAFQNKFFLFFLVLSISIVSVSASTIWTGFGNVDELDNRGGNLFGSNVPQGNSNFTVKEKLGVGSDSSPIVVDFDGNGQNNVVVFDGNIGYMYDNQGELVNTISMNGTICGTPSLSGDNINLPDGRVVIGVVTVTGTHYNFNIVGKSQITSTLYINQSLHMGAIASSCVVFNDHVLDAEETVFYVPMNNNSINRIDARVTPTNTTPTIEQNAGTVPAGNSLVKAAVSTPFVFGNSMRDFDVDGNSELTYIYSSNGADCRFIVYEPATETYSNTILNAGALCTDGISVFARLGGPSAVPSLIVAWNRQTSNSNDMRVYDSALALKFSVGFASTNFNYTVPAVANIDQDASETNEVCAMTTTGATGTFRCWTSDGVLMLTRNITSFMGQYMSIGEYDGNGSNSEVLTYLGIFQVPDANNTNLTEIKDLETDSVSDSRPLPVSVLNSAEFFKDVFSVSDSQIVFSIVNSSQAVCGNSVCELTETIFNCFVDCGTNVTAPPTNETLGSFGYNQECSQDSDCFGDLTCTNGLCSGLNKGDACTQNFECRSGVCNDNNFCDDIDFTDSVTDFFWILGVRSDSSRIFLGLIVLAVATLAMAGVGSTVGVAGGVAGGIIGFLGGLFLSFTLGWFPVWTLFIFLFTMLAVIMIMLLFKGVMQE